MIDDDAEYRPQWRRSSSIKGLSVQSIHNPRILLRDATGVSCLKSASVKVIIAFRFESAVLLILSPSLLETREVTKPFVLLSRSRLRELHLRQGFVVSR